MSENIRDKLICALFNTEEKVKWHLSSNIINYLLTNRGKVERAFIDDIDKVWLEIVFPYRLVYCRQLEEICCHYDV